MSLFAVDSVTLLVALVFLLAGTIKGVIGIGLPTTALTFLTLSVSPLTALGLNFLPMLITNLYQLKQADDIGGLCRSYWRFAVVMIGFMAVFSWLAASFGDDVIKLMIALSILAFTMNQLFGHALYLPPHLDRPAQYGLGGVAGILGGLTSVWGVPVTIYLVMKNVTPKQFVDASGFLISLGCVPIFFGYSMTSVFHSGLIADGLVGSATALIGFSIGERIRAFVSAPYFRKVVLVMFSIMGLRLGYSALVSFIPA